MNHTTHRADVCTPPPALGTLDRNGIASRLVWVASDADSAAQLLKLFRNRKASAENDAIWEGYWALTFNAESGVKKLRDLGGLLFLGQPAALQAARTLHTTLTGAAA